MVLEASRGGIKKAVAVALALEGDRGGCFSPQIHMIRGVDRHDPNESVDVVVAVGVAVS
jgi:hypothetical protein